MQVWLVWLIWIFLELASQILELYTFDVRMRYFISFYFFWGCCNFKEHNLLTCSDFKNLRSLEICGGGLTDAGVKNIKDLTTLRRLNLSQNCNLTDKTLELISGTYNLFTLNSGNCLSLSLSLSSLYLGLSLIAWNAFLKCRTDRSSVFECIELPHYQLRSAAPEAAEEFEAAHSGVLQGYGQRHQEASVDWTPEPSDRPTQVVASFLEDLLQSIEEQHCKYCPVGGREMGEV